MTLHTMLLFEVHIYIYVHIGMLRPPINSYDPGIVMYFDRGSLKKFNFDIFIRVYIPAIRLNNSIDMPSRSIGLKDCL